MRPNLLNNMKNWIEMHDLHAMRLSAIIKSYFAEHASFWFLSIYYFFEYVRPQTLYRAIDILPWSSIFMALAIVFAFTDKSVNWVSNSCNKLFYAFIFVIIISSLLSYHPKISWDYKNVMLGWLIVYILTITIVNTERRLFLFIIVYLLFSLKMAQHGAFAWAGRGFSFASWGLVGAPGWFKNSGEYAIQMLIYGSLAMSLFVALQIRWGIAKKMVLLCLAVMGYMAVMGASSRGAQLALAAIAIWIILKHKNGLKGIIMLALITLALLNFLPEEQMQRFRDMGEDPSSLQRLEYWKIGIELALEHPFLGIGYMNWMPYVTSLYPGGVGPYQTVQVPHSIYVEAAAELGLIGFILFLLMMGYAFYLNAKSRKLSHELNNRFIFYLTYGLDAGLLGYAVAGAFVTVLYYPFFWIQIAMIVATNNIIKNIHLPTANERDKKRSAQH